MTNANPVTPSGDLRSAETRTASGAQRSSTNVIWNWAGVIVEAVCGFVIVPVLIGGLGDEMYGTWVLIGSLTGTFGILDLGLRAAVGRYIALYRTRSDFERLESVLGTAAMALTLMGLLSFLVVLSLAWVLPAAYGLPLERRQTVTIATVVVGGQLALFFIVKLFDAILWATKRFDIINAIGIPTSIVRTGLIVWLIGSGKGSILTVAWISIAMVAVSGVAKVGFAYRALAGAQISIRNARRETFYTLVGFGSWNLIISVVAIARARLCPLLVGAVVGVGAVAPLSVAMRLPAIAMQVLIAATGVVAPVSVEIHALDDTQGRRKLLFRGTLWSLSLALYFTSLFIWLGKPLLALWIRSDFADYWSYVVTLSCGDILVMTMAVSRGMILAMARHKRLALFVMAEALSALAGGAILATVFGLFGFMVALAISGAVFRGLLPMLLICRVASIRITELVRESFLVPVLCALVAALPLHIITHSVTPDTWALMIFYGVAYTLFYWSIVAIVVYGPERALGMLRSRKWMPS